MATDIRQQLSQDVIFLTPFTQVGVDNFNFGHRDQLIRVFQRSIDNSRVRGGPTKNLFIARLPLLKPDTTLTRQDTKGDILDELWQAAHGLQQVNGDEGGAGPGDENDHVDDENDDHNADAGDAPPAGWERQARRRHLKMGRVKRNENISKWDVSSATNMNHMFAGGASFNGDISKWDVSTVTCMARMFMGKLRNTKSALSNFKCDISKWDVSSVNDMSGMFWGAASFNGDISKWDAYTYADVYRIYG